MSKPEQRVVDARQALDRAREARQANRNEATAAAVAIAQQHFDDARRALARFDVC